MRRQKTMGRSGGNRSTHQVKDIQKTSSLNQINAEINKVREAFAYCGNVTDPYFRLVRNADRIPLFPDELKSRVITFLLFEMDAAGRGLGNGA